MIDIAEQKTGFRLMDNQPNAAADPYRPESLVFRLVELVETHSRVGRIELQVKGGRLDGLLILAGQAAKTGCEGSSNAEIYE